MTLKGVERAAKGVGIRAACALMARTARPAGLPDWNEPTRVLVLRQDRIGDAIVSTGLFRAIRSVSPRIRVDVLASPRNAVLLRRDDDVQVVHVFDKRRPRTFGSLARRLRATRYDAVVDCMMTAPSMTALMLMMATGAPNRIGLAGRGVDAALTVAVPPLTGAEHIIDRMAALGMAFGLDPSATDWRPRLAVRPAERALAEDRWDTATLRGARRVLVNVSAGRPNRAWPEARFVETILAIRRRHPDIGVALVGSPADGSRVQAIAREAAAAAIPTPELADVIALVATAHVVFTPDTSIVHMASAFRTPALVMFPTREGAEQWGLYRSPGIDLVGDVESLEDLPTERVLAELDVLIAGS